MMPQTSQDVWLRFDSKKKRDDQVWVLGFRARICECPQEDAGRASGVHLRADPGKPDYAQRVDGAPDGVVTLYVERSETAAEQRAKGCVKIPNPLPLAASPIFPKYLLIYLSRQVTQTGPRKRTGLRSGKWLA